MILHIPHSSTFIPMSEGFIQNPQVIRKELQLLTDWYTDELFDLPKHTKIVTPFSRIFCDVERFEDDELEEMSIFGMGVLYEKTDSGELIRIVNKDLREQIFTNYYRPHHETFTSMVKNDLDQQGKCLIVDCHSFPLKPFNSSVYKESFRPDFNIGTHSYHTPKELVNISKNYFESQGYSLGIDFPYCGTIVPMDYFEKDQRVKSIMLEVNRSLYLNEETGEKSNSFRKIKQIVTGFLELLERAEIT